MTQDGPANPAQSNGAPGAPPAPPPPGAPRRIAVVISRYNATVTDRLLEGATRAFSARHDSSGLTVVQAPGAFELPALCLIAAKSGRFDGVLAIGCIVKGETR